MQDIVRRRVSEPTPVPLQKPISQPESFRFSSLRKGVERTFELSGNLLNYLQRWSGDAAERQEVVHAPLHSEAAAVPIHKAQVQPHHAKTARKRVNLKAAAHKAKHHLKTPIGKLVVAQALTAVLVVGLLFSLHAMVPSTQSQVAAADQAPKTQRYLPRVGAYVTPQPFSENLADVAQSTQQQAWITPWNLSAVAQNADRYSSLSAFWLSVGSDGVSFTPKADWSLWKNYLTTNKKDGQHYYLTVSGDPDATFLALSDPEKRSQHIAGLLKLVQDNGFDGIDIDYEGLGSQNRDLFSQFISQLAATFKPAGKLVSVTVEARIGTDPPMDWAALSQSANQVRIMAYDYHSQTTGAPGPIASLGWIKELLDYAQRTIPSSKLVIGLGDYGYDWTQPSDSSQSWGGVGISYDQATALAKQYNQKVTAATGIDDRGYDIGGVPNFSYVDGQQHQHAVWFEDQSSMQAKLDLVSQYQTAGVIFWSVGIASIK